MVSWRVPRGGFSGLSVWQRLAFHQVDWVCPPNQTSPTVSTAERVLHQWNHSLQPPAAGIT